MEHIDEGYLVNHFHEAVENGSIRAYFQPVFRSYTGKILGAETLARWFDPYGKMLPPDAFIPVLEQNGLIFDLDMEILRQACVLYKELKDRGTPLHSFSVNLSRHDFMHENLFEKVAKTLDTYDVPHEAIKLEITESLMLEDADTFRRVFDRFVDSHFSIWLDDFGSGYSSLNMLQTFSFDVVKFDILFLMDLSLKGRQLLGSMISMVKTLGIHTLCEGVETKEQRDFLMTTGCEVHQGFFYAKPVSAEALKALISEKPDIAETLEDKDYWNRIGRLNFLSPNPLKDFSEAKEIKAEQNEDFGSIDNSLALLECSHNQFNYVYATKEYKERIGDLGFDSINGLETALSNQRSHQYMMLSKIILEAIEKGTVQIMEYAYRNVYYRFSVQLLARKKGWVMLGVRLSTFDSEQEVRTAQEMLNYSSALLSTYDLAVLIFPEKHLVKRIYTANKLPVYDQETSMMGSLEKFCEAEVEPVDQKRYLQFMDFSTMTERIEATPERFIQGFFRMRWGNIPDNWHTARVTQIPSYSEKAYLLTIQSVHGDIKQWLDKLVTKYPDYL